MRHPDTRCCPQFRALQFITRFSLGMIAQREWCGHNALTQVRRNHRDGCHRDGRRSIDRCRDRQGDGPQRVAHPSGGAIAAGPLD